MGRASLAWTSCRRRGRTHTRRRGHNCQERRRCPSAARRRAAYRRRARRCCRSRRAPPGRLPRVVFPPSIRLRCERTCTRRRRRCRCDRRRPRADRRIAMRKCRSVHRRDFRWASGAPVRSSSRRCGHTRRLRRALGRVRSRSACRPRGARPCRRHRRRRDRRARYATAACTAALRSR